MKRKGISRAALIAVIFGSASGAANATTIATKGYVDGAVNMLTSVDASMYNSLAAKANTADVNTALAGKADTATVNSALAGKANTADVTSAITTATAGMATQTWVGTQGYLTGADVSGKADTTYVDTQLATKADVTALDAKANTADVTTALATKADVTALDAKANTADVTTAIATATTDMATQTWVGTQGYLTGADVSGKADTTYVDTQLATKADVTALDAKANAADVTTEINTAIAGKADTTYVDTQLAGKANSADVTTEISTAISGATADMATQTWTNAQGFVKDADVATAVANGTTGKSDKVVGAAAGNLAGLDATGNLTDSGVSAATVTALETTVAGKQDKLTATAANQLLISTDAAGGTAWVSLTPDTFVAIP
jgi:hypothetical protein